MGDDLGAAELRELIARAYASFDHVAIAPLRQLGPNEWLLELFHGPTLAFKDIALQLLGLLFEHFLARRERAITIVGATSGDTGSAAIAACAGRAHMRIVILHPHGRISEVQRRQMTTVAADNVHNVAIKGTFDDCQSLVKALFNDAALRRRAEPRCDQLDQLGRIMAQVVYYVTAALALGGPWRQVAFAVPTGNFGDVYAGYVAPHGPADRPADRRDQPQRHPGAVLRGGIVQRGRGGADHEPEHGHPGREQLRAPALRSVRG